MLFGKDKGREVLVKESTVEWRLPVINFIELYNVEILDYSIMYVTNSLI